jgi:diguanylate cyclase (GGDEF)-like protein
MSPEQASKASSAQRLRADRIQLLYWQSFPAVFVSVAVAALVAMLLWPAASHFAVTAWFAVLLATSMARLALFWAYRAKAPTGLLLLDWERPYFVTLMASTMTWGLGAVWIMPKDSLLHQTMVLFALIGMAGGALSVYSAVRWLAIATIAVILLPVTGWLLLTGERPALLLSLGVAIFCVSALRATKVLSTAMEQNFEMTHELREAKEAAERMASTDLLTGLTSRRAFLERADAPYQYCRRNELDVSVVVLDLDNFKQINDTRGHAVGDAALQHAARVIHGSLRKSDLCCRWGGEEFVVLLPDTSLEEACGVAEKLRATIAASPAATATGELSLTASFGVAEGERSLEALIDRADGALYQAKNEGRNRVARAEPLAGPLPSPAAG